MKKHSSMGCLLAAVVACGSPTDEAPDTREPIEENCRRLSTRSPSGECVAVQVNGVLEEPFVIERENWSMEGVLTRPVVAEPYEAPVVVLLHGSGPQSRHGGLAGSLGVDFGTTVEVYRSFAEQMARRGVATLRYDKRSCFAEAVPACANRISDYPGDVNDIRVDDFVADARAAVRGLAGYPGLAPNDVIIAGHSQGGSFVPHLVATEPTVSAGIGLAAPALPLVETLAGQLRVAADHLEAQDASAYAADIDQLRALAEQYEHELTQVLAGTWPEPSWLGGSPAFWRGFADWTDRPASDLSAVADKQAPLLYVSGDLDFNVWPAHLERYATLGESVPGLDLSTSLFVGVTHAFVPVVSGRPPGSHEIEPHFSPVVIQHIADWLAAYDRPPR